MAPADSAASSCAVASARSSRWWTRYDTPSAASRSRCRRASGAAGRGTRSPSSTSALSTYDAALTPKPSEKPPVTTSSPASGANSTCDRTAALQIPLFAATSASGRTRAGSNDPAAGLKKTVPTDVPTATTKTS
ncbi:MAG: hypothetical protein M3510_07750, partial [Actinomycetota bacterium]|nr:hypothetical protein [Actinomycetota bacterium]